MEKPPTPQHTPGTSFLDLPAELRNWVYEAALSPTLQVADDPWMPFPPWSRFSALLALALTSRQVSAEATSLFYKKLSRHVWLHFDDALRLHDFHAFASRRGEHARRLQFVLRADMHDSSALSQPLYWNGEDLYEYDYIDHFMHHDSAELIISQPGWDARYFPETGRLFRFPLPAAGGDGGDGGGSSSGSRIADELHPDCVLRKAWHRSVGLPGGLGRHNTVVWPMLQGSLRLTTSVCMEERCLRRPEHTYYHHCTIVELAGELRDLDFSRFPVAAKRARRYHQSRRFGDSYGASPRDWGEWADDRSESEVDSWAPSSWYPDEDEMSEVELGEERDEGDQDGDPLLSDV